MISDPQNKETGKEQALISHNHAVFGMVFSC